MTKASSRGLKSDASGKCCYRLPERRCKQNDRIWTVQLDARHRHFGPARFRIGTRNLLQIHSSGWKQRLDGIKSRGFRYTVEQWVPVVLQVRVFNLWNIVIRFQSRKRILFIQIDSSNISSERLRAWRSVYYSSPSIHLHRNIDVWLKQLGFHIIKKTRTPRRKLWPRTFTARFGDKYRTSDISLRRVRCDGFSLVFLKLIVDVWNC